MPMAIIKRYELCSTESSDWFRTPTALLGEQITEALGTIRFLLSRRELLAGKHLVAVGTREALTMPWGVLVRDSTLVDHSIALHAALSILFLVTLDTHDFLVTWYETLISDWLQAHFAAETLFVPLFSFVLVLFHPCPK